MNLAHARTANVAAILNQIKTTEKLSNIWRKRNTNSLCIWFSFVRTQPPSKSSNPKPKQKITRNSSSIFFCSFWMIENSHLNVWFVKKWIKFNFVCIFVSLSSCLLLFWFWCHLFDVFPFHFISFFINQSGIEAFCFGFSLFLGSLSISLIAFAHRIRSVGLHFDALHVPEKCKNETNWIHNSHSFHWTEGKKTNYY